MVWVAWTHQEPLPEEARRPLTIPRERRNKSNSLLIWIECNFLILVPALTNPAALIPTMLCAVYQRTLIIALPGHVPWAGAHHPQATRGDIADQQFADLKIFWQALLSAHLIQNKN